MDNRKQLSQRFLDKAGWGQAHRAFLAGDASDRSYDRLAMAGKTAVLMDAPPGKGDDPLIFVAIARHLAALGLSAPRILAEDFDNGFLLLEDLGDGLFAKLTQADPTVEISLYSAASDVLLHLQSSPAPDDLPDLSAADWAEAAGFALDWYRFAITGDHAPKVDFQKVLTDLLGIHADGPRVMILRDYHAENLLWLPERVGVARVGLLDFQLAQMGQPGYDLVSLLQDARRDVSPLIETAMVQRFSDKAGVSAKAFADGYAVLGAQRSLRILGIFARLCLVGGKPGYLPLIPRVWQHVQHNLAKAPLAPLAKICGALLPPPSPANLAKIGDQCARFR